VELNITISREEQEQAFQQTTLRIRTSSVDKKAKDLRTVAEKQGGRVRSSTFSRDPDGRELANVWLHVPMKNYPGLMQSLDSFGKVENVTVQRQDRTGTPIDEANAPADISIQIYSQGNIVSHQSGPLATLRRTLAQKRWRNHVEFAYDWGRDCIPRPMGNRDHRDRLDRKTRDASAAVGGTVAAATPQRVGNEDGPPSGR
jgi:hypothetical protein